MAAHLVDLAVFLMQAEPPASLGREIILDLQADDRRDASEGIDYHPDEGAVAQPHPMRYVDAL